MYRKLFKQYENIENQVKKRIPLIHQASLKIIKQKDSRNYKNKQMH
jgi:hypothetical protein